MTKGKRGGKISPAIDVQPLTASPDCSDPPVGGERKAGKKIVRKKMLGY